MIRPLGENLQWVNSALSALERNDVEAFFTLISKLSISEDMLPFKYHLMGLSAIRMGNFSDALAFFKQASDANPNARIHMEACSFCAAKLGMLSDSMFYMKMSATCDEPSESELLLLPAWLGSAEEQILDIKERPFFKKAQEAYAAGHLNATIENLQQALNADPFNVDSWLLIYKTMLGLNRINDAVQAMKAAIDSSTDSDDIDIQTLMESFFFATKLGLKEDAKLFFQRASSIADDSDPFIDAVKISSLSSLGEDNIGYKKALNDWVLNYLDNGPNNEVLPFLGKRIRLGVYSSRFNAGYGIDPIVNFLMELASRGDLTWLDIHIYSNAEFMDVATRRLASNVKAFRNVSNIDPYTLSRIMKNDGLHFLWDLDGFEFGGSPVLHNEVAIPYRWINSPSFEKGKHHSVSNVSLENETNLSAGPFALPIDFIPQQDDKREITRWRIALSMSPVELTDELLGEFAELKRRNPVFKLVLDTKKLGGVSFVDQIEQKFNKYGLQNFIEFIEPYENEDQYLSTLFGNSDYVLIPQNGDDLQVSYYAVMFDCRILTIETTSSFLSSSFLKSFSLDVAIHEDMGGVIDLLVHEFDHVDDYYYKLSDQRDKILNNMSTKSRYEKVDCFADLLKSKICEVYDDEITSLIFKGDV